MWSQAKGYLIFELIYVFKYDSSGIFIEIKSGRNERNILREVESRGQIAITCWKPFPGKIETPSPRICPELNWRLNDLVSFDDGVSILRESGVAVLVTNQLRYELL